MVLVDKALSLIGTPMGMGPLYLSQPAMHARRLAHESGGSHLQWGHVYNHFDEEHGKLWLWIAATHAIELPGFAEKIEVSLQSSMVSINAHEFLQDGDNLNIFQEQDEAMDVSWVPVEPDGSLPSSSSSEPSNKRRKTS